jgi:hypothetical protein
MEKGAGIHNLHACMYNVHVILLKSKGAGKHIRNSPDGKEY